MRNIFNFNKKERISFCKSINSTVSSTSLTAQVLMANQRILMAPSPVLPAKVLMAPMRVLPTQVLISPPRVLPGQVLMAPPGVFLRRS